MISHIFVMPRISTRASSKENTLEIQWRRAIFQSLKTLWLLRSCCKSIHCFVVIFKISCNFSSGQSLLVKALIIFFSVLWTFAEAGQKIYFLQNKVWQIEVYTLFKGQHRLVSFCNFRFFSKRFRQVWSKNCHENLRTFLKIVKMHRKNMFYEVVCHQANKMASLLIIYYGTPP